MISDATKQIHSPPTLVDKAGKSASRLLKPLTISTGLFAILASFLISLASEVSSGLPFLVTFCILSSWVFTDWLKWIRLNRYVAYLLMAGVGAFASYSFWNVLQSGTPPLWIVALMLVWVQLPLFFTEKQRRTFEQIGVFLILELVVAALINNTVLFGITMLPVLFIGCQVLILFSSYVTVSSQGIEVKARLSIRDYIKFFLSGTKPSVQQDLILFSSQGMERERPRWLLTTFPIVAGILAFAVIFFYCLPRTNEGAFSSQMLQNARIGFADKMTLAQMGEVLRDDSPVLRATFERIKGQPVTLSEPPYIRVLTLSDYQPEKGKAYWLKTKADLQLRSIPDRWELSESEKRNLFTKVEFKMIASLGDNRPSIPPFYDLSPNVEHRLSFLEWSLWHPNVQGEEIKLDSTYQLATSAFRDGEQSRFTPQPASYFEKQAKFDRGYFRSLLSFQGHRFRVLMEVRDQQLSQQRLLDGPLVDQALALEKYLSSGKDFKYTLNLNQKPDPLLNPIEDFVRNIKAGHCQYFASTLCMQLRSLGIPSRIVIGFRPLEYNSVGQFYLVRQQDAHAWVESYFSREELEKSKLANTERFSSGGWIRFDPTPPNDRMVASSMGRTTNSQTLQAAEEFWQDYVIEMDKKRQFGVYDIFSAVGGTRFDNLMLNFQAAITRSPTSGSSPSRTWLLPVAIVFLGGLGIGLVMLSAKIAPRLLPKHLRSILIGAENFDRELAYDYYRRVVRSMRRLGFRRKAGQTHAELLQEFDSWLNHEAIDPTQRPNLQLVLNQYYGERFGDAPPDTNLMNIGQELEKLETLANALSKNRSAKKSIAVSPQSATPKLPSV